MKKTVPLDQIRIDGDTQSRCEIDMFVVADYAEDMSAGVQFPPGEAVFDGVAYWLWDGFHRYHAELKRESGSMALNVQKGTVEDARWLAVGANKEADRSGLRRTNKDKRKAVETALQLRPKMSDRAIAEHCGVHHQMVATARKQVDESSTCATERIGRDGKTYPASGGKGQRESQRLEADEAASNRNFTERGEPKHQSDFFADDNRLPSERMGLEMAEASSSKLGSYVTLDAWNGMSKAARHQLIADAEGDAKFNAQGDNENIEWALWSWNPVTGCLHNCPYCYARDIAERFYVQKFAPSLWPGRLKAPSNTTFPEAKAREWMGHKNVFVCSMADLFGRWVPVEWIEAVLDEVRAAPQWNFLFLTKFPIRMAEFKFPDNAWVGTTVDCQARVANAEKAFRKVKAGVKWLSIEPLIEPLKFADLGAFQWIVIGGSSRSSQTPEWHPPRKWVWEIEKEAKKLGVSFYEKSNLHGRIRGYPGQPIYAEPDEAPELLRYLPTDKG